MTTAPVVTEISKEQPKRAVIMPTQVHTGYLALLFFVASLALYFMTTNGQHFSVDGVAYYQQSKALLFHGSFKYDPPLHWDATTYWSYTYWAEGLSIAYIPLLALFSFIIFPNDAAFQTIPDMSLNLLHDATYRYINLSNSIFTALTVSLLFLVALRFGFSRKRAAVVAGVFALASPAFGYHQQDFAQPLAGLCLVATILFLQYAIAAAAPGKRYGWLAAAGFCLGFMTLTRGESLVVAVPFFGLLVVWQYRKAKLKELFLTVVSFSSLLGPLLLFHFAVNLIKSGTLMGSQTKSFYSITDLARHYTICTLPS